MFWKKRDGAGANKRVQKRPKRADSANRGKGEASAESRGPQKRATTPGQESSRGKSAATRKKLISRIEEIPDHIKVLSLPGGEVSIKEEEKMAHYVVILSTKISRSAGSREGEGRPVAYIVCSEHVTSADSYRLTLRVRTENRGYDPKFVRASQEIIGIIYDQGRRRQGKSGRGATPVEEKFDGIIAEALERRASDVHIEVREDLAQVRYRVHGRLRPGIRIGHMPTDQAKQLVQVAYQVLADEKDVMFKEHEPQDANMDRVVNGQRLRIRFATMPAYPGGFDAVMRLIPLGKDASGNNLHDLGYSDEQITALEHALARPVGSIILSGTTGSGKSTTLVTMLTRKINKHNGLIKVITVEDPPEWIIPKATQVPVIRNRSGKGSEKHEFERSIRAAMRCDPDVLMIGEVRDEVSASLLKSAVQSGHQAMTTVHAGSGFGILGRLRSNGLDNDVLSSQDFIAALVSQSLVPVVCPQCALTYTEFKKLNEGNEEGKNLLSRVDNVLRPHERKNVRFVNDQGCDGPHCDGGVVDRTVVAEVISYDMELFKLVNAGRDLEAQELYLKNGGKTIMDHGIEKMRAGMCDPRDIEENLGPIEPTPYMEIFGRAVEREEEARPVSVTA